MIAVHRLLNYEVIDQWVRSVQTHLTAILGRAASPDGAGGRAEWLLLRCGDTLRYDLRYFEEVKYKSVLDLIEDLEQLAAEFPGIVPADLAMPARALIQDAERKRFLNG